ncbi:MAG: SpoIIE family protein phosphatase [Acidobacteriaceae bacterium]
METRSGTGDTRRSVMPLLLVDGARREEHRIERTPFTVGRASDRDIVLDHAYISRFHASITYDGTSFWIEDTGSRHGTLHNGAPVTRARINIGDEVRLGGPDGPRLRFGDERSASSSWRGLMEGIKPQGDSELEKLRWFVEAARRLNAAGAVDQVLAALVETALELTRFERGYVFLCVKDQLEFTTGRNNRGESLAVNESVSQTAIKKALDTAAPYILTDTLSAETELRSQSMVMQNIRAVIAIPLRMRSRDGSKGETLGVLYLDSRLTPGLLSEADHGLLRTVAAEAAALMENARLVLADEEARRYREELAFAAGVQQRLMAVQLPKLSFATIDGRNLPCKEIGGDFFDVLADEHGVAVVLADVSGKGASAAILASTLQGMVYSHLMSGMALDRLAAAVNAFLCVKDVGKYATMVIVCVDPSGQAEYINCGHEPPLLIRWTADGSTCRAEALEGGNLPVGLIRDASFTSGRVHLQPGERMLVVSDGVTEAENADGEFFGNARLAAAAEACGGINGLLRSLEEFCGTTPASDDRTVVEISIPAAVAAIP